MDAEYEVYQIYNLLSKLEPLHVHEIALTFIAIGSVLAGGGKLLGVLSNDKTDVIDQDDTNI